MNHKYTYDAEGRLLTETNYEAIFDFISSCVHEYNDAGYVIKTTEYHNGVYAYSCEHEYNDQNQLLQTVERTNDYSVTRVINYTYYASGLTESETRYRGESDELECVISPPLFSNYSQQNP